MQTHVVFLSPLVLALALSFPSSSIPLDLLLSLTRLAAQLLDERNTVYEYTCCTRLYINDDEFAVSVQHRSRAVHEITSARRTTRWSTITEYSASVSVTIKKIVFQYLCVFFSLSYSEADSPSLSLPLVLSFSFDNPQSASILIRSIALFLLQLPDLHSPPVQCVCVKRCNTEFYTLTISIGYCVQFSCDAHSRIDANSLIWILIAFIQLFCSILFCPLFLMSSATFFLSSQSLPLIFRYNFFSLPLFWFDYRATLLLVPLLGMQYVLTPFKPEPGHPWEIVYEVVSAFTTSFQVSGKEMMHRVARCNGA